jgi:hypothetical protein
MSFLLQLFTRARFDFYTFKDCLSETEALASARIAIHPMWSRYRSWFAATARSMVSRSKPLVVIHGSTDYGPMREWHVRLLKALSIGSGAVIVPTMNDFILALRLANKQASRNS